MSMSVIVDDSAKISVPLQRKLDSNGQPFFIGKLQFNGTLNFDDGGQSFMVFTSEEGYEELQIGPVDTSRRSSERKCGGVSNPGDRFIINLFSFRDKDKNTVYCSEVEQDDFNIKMKNGVFFTIFTAVPGREMIQITPLKVKNKISRTYSEERERQTA